MGGVLVRVEKKGFVMIVVDAMDDATADAIGDDGRVSLCRC